jgi:L-ascorbate metabolism protein UlaG (beta-lactamase superfamily)
MNKFRRVLSTMAILLLSVAGIAAIAVFIFIRQPQFGKQPSGERLERVKKSPNYRDGKFQNLHHTPDLAEGVSYYKVMKEFFFDKSKRSEPTDTLPSKKVDLLSINHAENVLVWFGHSSYFMQIDGKKILVDPVLSGAASPIKFTTPSYAGANVYTADDFPVIDYLFISHDHWDHIDYETLLKLKPKVKQVICGLGVGEHFEYWGYNNASIVEKDWNENVLLDSGFSVVVTPARHFSGRGFQRNQSLWVSFVLKTPTMKIYIGGDSGYDTFFETIGSEHGPFDLAILECGQYHPNWKYIHMMPEEAVQAATDLKAKKLFPVHWSKFTLAQHAWDAPILRVTAEGKKRGFPMLTPMIGEKVDLKDSVEYPAWWQGVK